MTDSLQRKTYRLYNWHIIGKVTGLEGFFFFLRFMLHIFYVGSLRNVYRNEQFPVSDYYSLFVTYYYIITNILGTTLKDVSFVNTC